MEQAESSSDTELQCSSCYNLDIPGYTLKVPLSNLKSTSISCHVCRTICRAIDSLDSEWLGTRQAYSYLCITKGKARLDFQVRAVDNRPLNEDEKVASRWVFPMSLHLFVKPSVSKFFALQTY